MSDRREALRRFGRNLCQARLGTGLTQEEVAMRAEISRSSVGRLEAGGSECGFLTAMALAEAVGVELEELVHGGEGSGPDRTRPDRRRGR